MSSKAAVSISVNEQITLRAMHVPDSPWLIVVRESASRLQTTKLAKEKRRNSHNALEFLNVIPKVPAVPNIYGIALTSLYIFSDVFAADARGHRTMDTSNGQPITCRFEAIDLDVDVETLRDTFGKYGT